MLAYILAIAVALASITLYLSAFFLPELHRKDDFFWSSVGLFYALVLWVCAGRITGGVLLGQSAAVALVFSFGWQTVKLRRALAHPDEQTNLEGFSLISWVQNRLGGQKKPVKTKLKLQTPVVKTAEETPTASQPQSVTPETPEPKNLTPEIETPSPVATFTETVAEVTNETEEAPEVIESLTALIEEKPLESAQETSETTIEAVTETISTAKKSPKKGFSFKNLFVFGQAKPTPSPQKPSITQALDKIDAETKSEAIEEDWGEETEISETAILETPTTTAEEITASETEITLEVTPRELDLEVDFEPFIDNDEIETVIEDYQPIGKTSLEQETLEVTETEEKFEVEESEIVAVEVIASESESAELSLEMESVSSPESIINEAVSQDSTETYDKTE